MTGKLTSFGRPAYIVLVVFLAILLDAAHGQHPLYTSDQNTYFLHALAREGHGFLEDDWTANTADPFPIFTLLIRFTYRFLGMGTVHAYHVAIIFVYLFSVLGIASKLFGISLRRRPLQFAVFALLFIGFHTVTFGQLTHDLTWRLKSGMAGFNFPGHYFIPIRFTALLFLSLYLFLSRRPMWAVLAASIAATFHPHLLLYAGSLTLAYMAVVWREEESMSRPLRIGGVSALLLSPITIHTIAGLTSVTSAETMKRAQEILVEIRIPHHVQVDQWIGMANEKILLVALALVLVRHTRIFLLLLIPFLTALALSVYYVATSDSSIGLMMPWRMVTFLAPLSIALILGSAVVAIGDRTLRLPLKRLRIVAVAAVCAVALGLFVRDGYVRSGSRYFLSGSADAVSPDLRKLCAHVKETVRKGDLYLVPPEKNYAQGLERFRLLTGAPILADLKVHPYRDEAIVEWYRRIWLAKKFYDAPPEEQCRRLAWMRGEFGITHVVTPVPVSCSGLTSTYRSPGFVVYEVPPVRR